MQPGVDSAVPVVPIGSNISFSTSEHGDSGAHVNDAAPPGRRIPRATRRYKQSRRNIKLSPQAVDLV